MSHTDDVSAPIRRLADLDLSDTKGDAAHYDDDNTTYHSQLYTGPIVDPHIHFFDFEQQSYPWLKGPEQIPSHPLVGNIDMLREKSYLLANLEADAAKHNVTTFVYVQAESSDTIKEAEYVENVAKSHPKVAGIVAFADLTDPNVDVVLTHLASLPHVRGIRQLLNFHPTKPELSNPTDLLAHPNFATNYALLAKHKLHFEFHAFHVQLQQGALLAQQYPNIAMVVNHSGLCVEHSEEGIEQWKDGLRALAAHPNVSIKVSGLGMTDNRWTAESIRPFILDCIDIFGVERCMFASNFPVEKVVGSYTDFYRAFKQVVASKFNAEQQKKLFHDNALRIYRIKTE